MPARKNELTPEEQSNLKIAGAELRRIRVERGLTGPKIEERTGHRIGKNQVSLIERGEVERPSMYLLVTLGKLYNKTPGEIARIYGYWDEPEGPSRLSGVNETLRKLEAIAQNLAPEKRKVWLDQVDTDATLHLLRMHYDDELDKR